MRFAVALPAWALALLAAAALALAWAAYARPLVPLPRRRQFTLSTLRALALLLAIACLLRPVKVTSSASERGEVVPILIDASRSMQVVDADGQPRIEAARDLVARSLMPVLSARFHPEVWTFGETLASAGDQPIAAIQSRSDLSGALRAIAGRYRDRRVPGVVVVSDGGDTGAQDAAAALDASSLRVFSIGVGNPAVTNDLEVTDVSAGDALLAESSLDLTASAANHGSPRAFDLRLLENGTPIEVRHFDARAQGGPVRAVFTVAPPSAAATLYTVEIPASADETVRENNRRSVLVEGPGRPRRVLIVEGAPGFEHSFVKRALGADTGLEVDSIVRKGRDAQGQATYFVLAPADRAPQLASGFPIDRDALFQYDALVLANIENDALSRAQLDLAAAFVNDRGGGLLVLGAKSFGPRGLAGTVVEDVLPLGLTDRGNGVVRAANEEGEKYRVDVTDDGRAHPVMRLDPRDEDTRRRWSAVPALAGAASLGEPRPGAQILAVVRTMDGARPLVAVQRYGKGRSMVFTGEASWRWRMQLPATDRTFELFWRQAARWLASGSGDPVSVVIPGRIGRGDAADVAVEVRNASFAPVADAQVVMQITLPGGERRDVAPSLNDARTGRYVADVRFDRAGVYHLMAEARRGTASLGSAEKWILVGGADAEMADPRLNEQVLRRVARATGGQYLRAGDVSTLPSLLSPVADHPVAPHVEDLWDNIWVFAAIVALLAGEWTLRRTWGLR